MGKRPAIILTFILLAGLIILWYFLRQGQRELFTDPYKAISTEAAIVIESSELKSFLGSLTSEKGLTAEFLKLKEFDLFNKKLRILTDQLNKPEFNLLINEGPAIIAFFPDSGGKLMPLLSMTVSAGTGIRDIRALFPASGSKSFNLRGPGGNEILGIPFTIENNRDTLFISVFSGLLITANSEKLLREAIVQSGRDNDVRDLAGFSKVQQASGKNENKVFVVLKNSAGVIRKLLRPEASAIADRLAASDATVSADIYLSNNGLILSGYSENSDSSGFITKYKSFRSARLNTFKVLPASTVLFETEVLTADTIYPGPGKSESMALAEKMKAAAGDEITRAYLEIKDKPFAENMLLICELANGAEAEQLFRTASGDKVKITYYEPDDQMKFPVYSNPFPGFTSYLQPGFVKSFDDAWIAFYNNYLVAGSSYATVTRFVYENILNKTLANDLIYRDFENSLPSTAGYIFYCVPSRVSDWLLQYLNDRIINSLRNYKSQVARIQAAGLQLSSSNGMVYNSVALSYREEAREESTTVWETLLDTLAVIKPFFFTNHNNGAKEIFVQDMKNKAYLINSAGRVLWKVQLQERITGNIYMVDIYRNGKYQILFSGKNYIHLLDRNGNYVDRYPFRLRSPATNSVVLFDYDNNSNYRLVIAGEDKQIYSYDKNGNTVKGWTTFKTTGIVTEEIYYFKVSGKDYIVASDGLSLYFLDRKGNTRVNLKETVIKASGSPIRLRQGASPSLVCTGPDGTIITTGFDGSVTRNKIKEFSREHRSDFFDVDGDGSGEYIFVDKGVLYLYDHDMKEMFTRDFVTENLAGPVNYVFSSSDRKIGVADLAGKRIYLIDKNGETMNGFPLKGASMFSIGKLSEKSNWNLVVGGTDRFLYNYVLNAE